MTERTFITLFEKYGFAERQAREVAGRGFDTLETIPLDRGEREAIQRAIDSARQRKQQASTDCEVEKARDYLARHAPHLLAAQPEGIDHG